MVPNPAFIFWAFIGNNAPKPINAPASQQCFEGASSVPSAAEAPPRHGRSSPAGTPASVWSLQFNQAGREEELQNGHEAGDTDAPHILP